MHKNKWFWLQLFAGEGAGAGASAGGEGGGDGAVSGANDGLAAEDQRLPKRSLERERREQKPSCLKVPCAPHR